MLWDVVRIEPAKASQTGGTDLGTQEAWLLSLSQSHMPLLCEGRGGEAS